MDGLIEELKDKYKLSKEEFEHVQERLIKRATEKVTTTNNPIVIIIGGQPGAGKTQLQLSAEKSLNQNAVICNADNFRDYHPLAKEYRKKYPQYYAEISAPYSHLWTLALQKHCREKKLNYILETTLQNGSGINDTMAAIKAAGFKVELHILAVDGRVSFLSTEVRYEKMIQKEKSGRIVGKEAHDLRYEAIPNSINLIAKNKQYDQLKIFGRNIVVSKEGDSNDLYLVTDNPVDPLKEYLTQRNKLWTSLENEYFNQKVQEVISLKVNRNAPAQEIESFKAALIFKSRSRRL